MNDIADALTMARNISRAEARAMVADVLDAIVAGAAKGEVALAGFGKFSVTRRPARPGRNPSTGEKIVIPPTNRVAFKAAKAFKDRVAG
ncbi:HU family DNA-binding protein [Sphingomonas lycopersici]|uniref:HU family DNA-binding protein n=1 Tax=Sphingomonas lycopersici TaxID=2951807 RepID=UPI002237AF80|nr:HU family DNA-binding protein [Sphingomonas lycopersici]